MHVFSSLRARLVLLLLVAFAPAFGFLFISYDKYRRHEAEDARRETLQLVRHASHTYQQQIEATRGLLLGVAKFGPGHLADPAACADLVSSLKSKTPLYTNFTVIKADGDVLCSMLPPRGPTNVRDRPYFRRALETRTFAIGECEVDPTQAKAGIGASYPVLDSAGVVQAVLVATLDLSWISTLAATTGMPTGTEIIAFDDDGTVLARSVEPARWIGKSAQETPLFQAILGHQAEGVLEEIDLDGAPRLFGFTSLLGSTQTRDLHVAVGIPTAVVFADANRIHFRYFTGLLLAAILTIATAWIGSDLFFVRRVKALVATAQRLQTGDLKARSGLPHGNGELSQLARGFDEMATALEARHAEAQQARAALQKAHTELEFRVQERTAELTAALESLRGEVVARMQAQADLRGLFDRVPIGLYRTTPSGEFLDANPALVQMLGYPDRQTLMEISAVDVYPDSEDRQHWQRLLAREGVVHNYEVRIRRRDGTSIWVRHSARAIRGKDGEVLAYEGAVEEVTERKRAEERLTQLSSAIEQTEDGAYITDRDGVIEYVNAAFERLTGFSRAESIGKTPKILRSGLHTREFYTQFWQTILSGDVFRAVFVNKRADGSLYHAEQTITPVRDSRGRVSHFVGVGRDISDRVRAEEQLRSSQEQLRALAAHLESIREEERTRISREIHDELGQAMTGLKMDLSWLASRLPGGPETLLQRIVSMVSLTDAMINVVRRIASELRPGILDDLGLVAAIEWLAQDFGSRAGLQCEFRSSLQDVEFDRELSTAVFRILQEALTNVVRHAGATQVEITLQQDDGLLILTVRDDGKGITAELVAGTKSLGFVGMRERALVHGGEVSVTSAPGEGTTVTATFPAKTAPKPDAGIGEMTDGPDSG